ncbi:MAG: hypothetical protein GX856_00515 [Gammaproteobacteria bacterium]|jgi:hypothetical protein|nr:hypothetical protein [Gammaproteobacteria bacterium]
MKILNIRDFVSAKNPTPLDIQRAHAKAVKRDYLFAADGRCFAPYTPAAPYLPDGRKGRWEKGRVVERKQA